MRTSTHPALLGLLLPCALACAQSAAPSIPIGTNLGFEDTSGQFPSGWKTTGGVAPTSGFEGNFAASLEPGSIITQTFNAAPAALPSDFTVSFTLMFDGSGPLENNGGVVKLLSNGGQGGGLLDLRVSPRGIEQPQSGNWLPSVKFAPSLGVPYRISIKVSGDPAKRRLETEVTRDGKPVARGTPLALAARDARLGGIAFEAGREHRVFLDAISFSGPQTPPNRAPVAPPVATAAAAAQAPAPRKSVVFPKEGLLRNPGFEENPATAGWTATTGANPAASPFGTGNAIVFSHRTKASLTQKFARPAPDFTCSVDYQINSVNTPQAFRMELLGGGKVIVEIRSGAGGLWEVRSQTGWRKIVRNDGNPPPPSPDAMRPATLQFVGRGFGTPQAEFDLAWTQPESTKWATCASRLTAFVNPPAAPIDTIRFARDMPMANSFTIDNVLVTPSAKPSPPPNRKLAAN